MSSKVVSDPSMSELPFEDGSIGITGEQPNPLAKKLGVGDSYPNDNTVLMGTGRNTSEWVRNPFFKVRYIQMVVFGFTTDVATGDGKFYLHIPRELDKYFLDYVHAMVITAGTTGTTDIQIANVTNSTDLLSTKLTIDSGETGSNTAATPAVINRSNFIVSQNDVLRVDVDAVSTTAPKGLVVTLGLRT